MYASHATENLPSEPRSSSATAAPCRPSFSGAFSSLIRIPPIATFVAGINSNGTARSSATSNGTGEVASAGTFASFAMPAGTSNSQSKRVKKSKLTTPQQSGGNDISTGTAAELPTVKVSKVCRAKRNLRRTRACHLSCLKTLRPSVQNGCERRAVVNHEPSDRGAASKLEVKRNVTLLLHDQRCLGHTWSRCLGDCCHTREHPVRSALWFQQLHQGLAVEATGHVQARAT
eukprot:CAMPEP_0117534664 /NCGR_PEP_ID=MMETSP0784-20121206/40529_1 /TAXON_ID=39447 /ORGANISM="" /LENGTH=230 /DNA_ID=CAMNT_0005331153 /DNA_START=418 /DNA_END=1109 /DNA_ORIENTATION=+